MNWLAGYPLTVWYPARSVQLTGKHIHYGCKVQTDKSGIAQPYLMVSGVILYDDGRCCCNFKGQAACRWAGLAEPAGRSRRARPGLGCAMHNQVTVIEKSNHHRTKLTLFTWVNSLCMPVLTVNWKGTAEFCTEKKRRSRLYMRFGISADFICLFSLRLLRDFSEGQHLFADGLGHCYMVCLKFQRLEDCISSKAVTVFSIVDLTKQWVLSLFGLVFRRDFRRVLNSDWDQRSAKNVKSFLLSDSLRPNFGLSDRWIQSQLTHRLILHAQDRLIS